MNGYIAIWKGKRIEVHAETSYKAQQLAAKQFGKYARSYDITIVLAEKDDQPVTHSTASL
jgi:hypothetical protein